MGRDDRRSRRRRSRMPPRARASCRLHGLPNRGAISVSIRATRSSKVLLPAMVKAGEVMATMCEGCRRSPRRRGPRSRLAPRAVRLPSALRPTDARRRRTARRHTDLDPSFPGHDERAHDALRPRPGRSPRGFSSLGQHVRQRLEVRGPECDRESPGNCPIGPVALHCSSVMAWSPDRVCSNVRTMNSPGALPSITPTTPG